MNKRTRKEFEAMPLQKLHRLRTDVDRFIAEIEGGPQREIDIAFEHSDPALVGRVLRTIGDPGAGTRYQIERIYCSIEKCPRCPHGDFWFRYRRSGNKGTLKKECVGFGAPMAFDHELLEQMKGGLREPVSYIFTKEPNQKAT